MRMELTHRQHPLPALSPREMGSLWEALLRGRRPIMPPMRKRCAPHARTTCHAVLFDEAH